jgi:hypothetical protein
MSSPVVKSSISRQAARLAQATPRSARLFCLTLALILAAGSPVASRRAAAADKTPDIATIRAAVDFYAASIKTLEGKGVSKWSRGPNSPGAKGGIPLTNDLRFDIVFLADIPNHKSFFDERKTYYLLGTNGDKMPFGIHTTTAFDGTLHFSMTHTHVVSPVETELAPDIPYDLNVSRNDATHNRSTPWDYSGLRISGGNLASFLRDPAARIDGQEKVNDANCVRVVVEPSKGEPTFIAWLDPAHDFLPRRWTRPKPAALQAKSADNSPKYLIQLDVFEFRKFPDLAGGNEKWFPVRGREHNWLDESHDDEITELKINPTIDGDRFSIQATTLVDGVRVNDSTGDGREASYTGGRQDLWEDRKRQLDDETRRMNVVLASLQNASATPGVGTDGLPKPGIVAEVLSLPGGTRYVIAACSVALVGVGVISILRKRRRGT